MEGIAWPIVIAGDLDIRLCRTAEAIGIEHIDLPEMDAWDAEGRRLELLPTMTKGRFLGLFAIDQEAIEVRLMQPVHHEAPVLLSRLNEALRSSGVSVPDDTSLPSALSMCVAHFGAS